MKSYLKFFAKLAGIAAVLVFFSLAQANGVTTVILQPTAGANGGGDEGGANTGKDAGTNGWNPAANEGASNVLRMYADNHTPWGQNPGFLKIETFTLPTQNIVSAKLWVYVQQFCNPDCSGLQALSETLRLHQVTRPWDEMTMSWDYYQSAAPMYDPVAITEREISFPPIGTNQYFNLGYVDFDITNLVK